MTSPLLPARALARRALPWTFAFALLAAPAARAAVSNDELARYADEVFAKAYPAGEPGAAVLVVKDGQVVLRKGYGMAHLELGVPIRPEMVFELGSITKQFTAAAVLMLQERGQLSVDDEVTKYLPDYPTHGQKITVHHLLTHISGIPSYTGLPEWLPRVREDLTVQQLIDMFKDKPLEFNPGEKWSYNNSAYILLGAVIEKVSGKTYEDFIEQEIFAPLGMKSSRYGHQNEVTPGRVEGYDKGEGGYKIAEYLSMTQPYAAGSLMSTVDDLAIWAEALAGGKVIKKESLERMTTPAKLTSGQSTRYAYGVGVSEEDDGARIIEHGGGIFGFVTDLLHIPGQRLVVVALSNNTSQDPEALVYRVARKALGTALEDRKGVALGAATLDEYVGVYRYNERLVQTVLREGDQLFIRRGTAEKKAILASSRDVFFDPEADVRLRFRRDAQGKIAGLDVVRRFGPDEMGARTDEAPPAERQAVQVDPGLYDAYAGVYELAPGFQLTLTREGGQLMGQATGQAKLELFPESETRFFLKAVDAQIEIQRGPDGKATGLTLFQGGREMPGKKVK